MGDKVLSRGVPMREFYRIPRHIGFIPDGNRRWAQARGLPKEAGYMHGVDPGIELYRECVRLGVKEISVYGFTQDNTRRPSRQTKAYQEACLSFARDVLKEGACLLVLGNARSPLFPPSLKPFATRTRGKGIKVNLLVNYGWEWDLRAAMGKIKNGKRLTSRSIIKNLASSEISRIDLIVRWGGRRRLSGFLPVQSVYADFYVVDSLWPDFTVPDFHKALSWYQEQDVTLGG